MTQPAPPRPRAIRKRDTLHRLTHDVDAWVATASPDGTPHLMPLSFLWTGTHLFLATAATNPTAQNLTHNPHLQLTLGTLRDVVHITATADPTPPTPTQAAAFATKAGFDPRPLPNYPFIRVTPTKIQAWRESNELKHRLLMQNTLWLP
ncbi:pyridoxamine 5'-phosphate oxidase family protein [Kribbella sandramycini]|uniref:General stress protein 26 n=1 Tax=Kribbella sandramycini TaxID=60450 RepID=A0A7Y4KYJ3_9ACTN|nr:pyridoxamine 5'-phosphate oxidase family protein [Kribbella sandramycini]MBB6569135.1 general stress protein 26 [Kribbella sandramycini]NOL41023.1 pyridoxamine 5'-phosphate oxidase family protein [Kribbella sandramycini]